MAINPSRQLPGKAVTSNEMFFDALVRHQIGLLRLSGSIRNEIFKVLDATEVDIGNKIETILARNQGLTRPSDVRRLDTLLKAIKAPRAEALKAVSAIWVKEMRDLAAAEPLFIDGAVKTVAPVILSTVIPDAGLLQALVTTKPFEGKVMRKWASSMAASDLSRMEDQIRIGLVQGESSQTIARRVLGTAAARGADGTMGMTRRNAEAITRTAVIAISNQAKRAYYSANSELFTNELYVATLDNRTCWSPGSIVTMGDGSMKPIGEIIEGDFVLGGLSGEPQKVLSTYNDVVSSTVAMYNEGGYIGETTHDHRILTEDGWRKAGALCLSADVPKQEVLRRVYQEPSRASQTACPQLLPRGAACCDKEIWDAKDGDPSHSGLSSGGKGPRDQGDRSEGHASTRRLQHDQGRRLCSGGDAGTAQGMGSEGQEDLIGELHARGEVREGQDLSGETRSNLLRKDEEDTSGPIERLDAGGSRNDGESHEGGLAESHSRTAGEPQQFREGSVAGSRVPKEGAGSAKERRRCNDRRTEGSSSDQTVGGNEGPVAGPCLQSEGAGSEEHPRSKSENGREREKECGCPDRGWADEEGGEVPQIGKREMVSPARVWGHEQNREQIIVSLTVENDPTYVVGGMIVHNTPICMSLDGQRFPIAEGPIPPLHFNCRSLRIAILDGETLGTRPAKASTEQQLLREYTADNNLPGVTSRSALPRGHKGRFDGFSRVRVRELTGTVPAKVTYQEWLTRQSAAFQNDTLGIARGALFRRGKLPLTKFVNRVGDEIPLSQLARTDRQAFLDAGLNPDAFT